MVDRRKCTTPFIVVLWGGNRKKPSFYCFAYFKYILTVEKMLITEKQSLLQNLSGMSLAPLTHKSLVRTPFKTTDCPNSTLSK